MSIRIRSLSIVAVSALALVSIVAPAGAFVRHSVPQGQDAKRIIIARKAPTLMQVALAQLAAPEPALIAKSGESTEIITPLAQKQLVAVAVAAAAALQTQVTAKLQTRSSDPVVQVNETADGVQGSATQTVALDGGATADMTLDLGAHVRNGEAQVDVGIKIKVTASDGSSEGVGIHVKDITGGKTPTCPTATGALTFSQPIEINETHDKTYAAARVQFGDVKSSETTKGKVTGQFQMSADGRLQPGAVTASATYDYARSASALFLQNNSRATSTASTSGELNATTGVLTTKGITTKATAHGFASPDAEAAQVVTTMVTKNINDALARLAQSARTAEANARKGECTVIELTPASGGKLTPRGSVGVTAVLKTKDGTVIQRVRWAAVPAKGSIAPRTANGAKPGFKVTGAATGPTTASINFKAVSPAGISSAPWTAGGDVAGFPKTYTGKVTLSKNVPMAGGSELTDWEATVTYTFKDRQTNPDGSQQALYDLTSVTLGSWTYTTDLPDVTCSMDAPVTGPATVKAGDLEIDVTKDGKWSAAFLIDAKTADKPNTCVTHGSPSVTAHGSMPAGPFLNNRLQDGGLRPMPAKGAISASGVTDIMELAIMPGAQGSASWNLQPGG